MPRVIGDTLEVTGAVDLDSTLNVDGVSTLSGNMVVNPLAGGVYATAIGIGSVLASVSPGSITTAQTWTLDITVTLNAARLSGIYDVFIQATSSASATERIFYRASISFVRNTLGDTAVIESVHEMDNRNTLVTFVGPTAIADGIRFTVHPTSTTLNRANATVIGSGGSSSTVVTSGVA